MLLSEEARNCRVQAERFAGKAEAPFLLHLAEAFEELAVKEQTAAKLPPNVWTASGRQLRLTALAEAAPSSPARSLLLRHRRCSVAVRVRAAGQRRDDADLPLIRPNLCGFRAHAIRRFVDGVQEIEAGKGLGALQLALAQVQNAEFRHEETTVGCRQCAPDLNGSRRIWPDSREKLAESPMRADQRRGNAATSS